MDRPILHRGWVVETQAIVDEFLHRKHFKLWECLRGEVDDKGPRADGRETHLSYGKVVCVLEVIPVFHLLKVSTGVVAHITSEPSNSIIGTRQCAVKSLPRHP
jgi:hypothetical protein